MDDSDDNSSDIDNQNQPQSTSESDTTSDRKSKGMTARLREGHAEPFEKRGRNRKDKG